MANVVFLGTEDSEATIYGSIRTLTVLDQGNGCEVLERSMPATKYGMVPANDWHTVKVFPFYSLAIVFAELYADGRI